MSWEREEFRSMDEQVQPRGLSAAEVEERVARGEVNVENYRSILIYTDTLIKLQARNCKVVIHGARLKIDYYTAEEMKITGQVGSLEFET